jgi:hypothetical protein
MLKAFWEKNWHRIYISFDMGLLIMGIFMSFIGGYSPICGNTQNDIRITIGTVCIALWFILFPAIDREKKDKIMSAIGFHVLTATVVLLIFMFEVRYLLGNMQQGKVCYDIMFCVGGIVVLAYLLYVLIGFIKTFFGLVVKAKKFIFPKLQDEASGVKNVIEAITAGVLSITAFGASIIGIVTLVKQFIDVF